MENKLLAFIAGVLFIFTGATATTLNPPYIEAQTDTGDGYISPGAAITINRKAGRSTTHYKITSQTTGEILAEGALAQNVVTWYAWENVSVEAYSELSGTTSTPVTADYKIYYNRQNDFQQHYNTTTTTTFNEKEGLLEAYLGRNNFVDGQEVDEFRFTGVGDDLGFTAKFSKGTAEDLPKYKYQTTGAEYSYAIANNGNTLTVAAPVGTKLTRVYIYYNTNKPNTTVSEGTITTSGTLSSWSPAAQTSPNQVVFTFNMETNVRNIYTCYQMTDPAAIPAERHVANIAEFMALPEYSRNVVIDGEVAVITHDLFKYDYKASQNTTAYQGLIVTDNSGPGNTPLYLLVNTTTKVIGDNSQIGQNSSKTDAKNFHASKFMATKTVNRQTVIDYDKSKIITGLAGSKEYLDGQLIMRMPAGLQPMMTDTKKVIDRPKPHGYTVEQLKTGEHDGEWVLLHYLQITDLDVTHTAANNTTWNKFIDPWTKDETNMADSFILRNYFICEGATASPYKNVYAKVWGLVCRHKFADGTEYHYILRTHWDGITNGKMNVYSNTVTVTVPAPVIMVNKVNENGQSNIDDIYTIDHDHNFHPFAELYYTKDGSKPNISEAREDPAIIKYDEEGNEISTPTTPDDMKGTFIYTGPFRIANDDGSSYNEYGNVTINAVSAVPIGNKSTTNLKDTSYYRFLWNSNANYNHKVNNVVTHHISDLGTFASTNPVTTGIMNVNPDSADLSTETEYFNLQGVRVNGNELVPGIYIERRGASCRKVLVK